MTTYDAIIIGGGLAGLTAAAHLARARRNVLVLERHSTIGGRARTDDVNGWLFNQGGHALYSNGVGRKALQGLGVEPDGVEAPLAGAQALIGGQTTPLPTGPIGVLRSGALGAAGKVQFAKMMATLSRADAASFASVTVDQWLSGQRDDVVALVKALVRLATYSTTTELMSAEAAIAQLQIGEAGVLYLHEGWAAMCAQIAGVATGHGANIITGVAVDGIDQPSGRFVVRTDQGEHEATTVVVAAGGPTLTARLLGIDETVFGPVGEAPQAACLDLALDAMPEHHQFVLGVDEPTYFSVHSPPARLSPDGRVAAVAMRYLHPDDDGSAKAHRASLEQIAARAGVTQPVHTRFLRRMTVANGVPLASAGGLAGRPGVEVPGMPGAFVAGDWIGAQGLLADAAIASGLEAAKLV